MSAETGHAANRVYLAQDGSLHLNGAAVYDANEVDISSNLNGLGGSSLTLTGVLRVKRSTVAAAGSAQANAASLATGFNSVTGADNTKGVILPTVAAGEIVIVANTHAANSLKVYPASGAQIDAAGANNAVTQTAAKVRVFVADSATQIYSMEGA